MVHYTEKERDYEKNYLQKHVMHTLKEYDFQISIKVIVKVMFYMHELKNKNLNLH